MLRVVLTAIVLSIIGFDASAQRAPLASTSNQMNLVEAFPALSFTQPLLLTHADDGSDRVFVVEKTGVVHVFDNDPDVVSTSVFLDVSDKLLPPGHPDVGETGLLSLAFHPDYATNGKLYISYVDENLVSILSEMLISDDPDAADLSTERVLLEIQQPQRNHNGGHIAFGPDGYLYMAFGDGFSESSREGVEHGDPLRHGQNPATWFSSMLRIDVDRQQDNLAYGIPEDNPFVGNELGWKEEIFAYGFRNPWRFSFDRTSGDLWLADVGDKKAEEIDLVESGKNYGWSLKEATHCYEDVPCDTTLWVNLTDPIFEYLRDVGVSVTGGYVYRGSAHQDLLGKYIYGDYGSRRVWALDYSAGTVQSNELLATAAGQISSFGEDEAGEMYVIGIGGVLWKFEAMSATSTVPEPEGIRSYTLHQNYPNPFRGETRIAFEAPKAGPIRLIVYDLLGREIRTFGDRMYEVGRHEIVWDGRDDSGKRAAGGLYVYTLETPYVRDARTLVLLN